MSSCSPWNYQSRKDSHPDGTPESVLKTRWTSKLAGENKVPQTELSLSPPRRLLTLLLTVLSHPFSPTLCLYLSLPDTTPELYKLVPTTCLASRSQWPTLHQTAQNRNSGVPLGFFPYFSYQILLHPLSSRLSHLSFLLMSHNHHLHPSPHHSWISEEVSLPLCLLTCLSSRLHTTDKIALLKCKYDHSICCPQNVDSNKPGLPSVSKSGSFCHF